MRIAFQHHRKQILLKHTVWVPTLDNLAIVPYLLSFKNLKYQVVQQALVQGLEENQYICQVHEKAEFHIV